MSAEIIKLKFARRRAPFHLFPGCEQLYEIHDELRRIDSAIAVLNYNRLCTIWAYRAEAKRAIEREDGHPQRPGKRDQINADKLDLQIEEAAAKLPASDELAEEVAVGRPIVEPTGGAPG